MSSCRLFLTHLKFFQKTRFGAAICKPRHWNWNWYYRRQLFPVPLGLWTPNLPGCWFGLRGPQPQSHVILQYRGHVKNQKRFIFTFTRPMDPKLGNLGWGDRTYKITWHIDRVVMWQIKNFISPLWQGLCITWQKKSVIFPLSQGLWTPTLAGRLRMGILHLWHLDHVVTCQVKNILSPHSQVSLLLKRGRVLNEEGDPSKKSRDT